MININHVTLVGRLTKDIELRKTNANTSVAQFNVAIDRRFKSSDPNALNADFINCLAWKQSAEFLAKYGGKGDIVSVEGRIQTRSYEDKNNKKIYVTEIVADNVQLITKATQSAVQDEENVLPEPSYEDNNNYVSPDYPSINTGSGSLEISDDDLPFY